MKTIEFRISKDGKVAIDVSGVDDATCAEITKAYEIALGTVENVSRKPEYYVELEPTKQYVYDDE